MRNIFAIFLIIGYLFATPATKEDIKELKIQMQNNMKELRGDIKLILNKISEMDKKIYAN